MHTGREYPFEYIVDKLIAFQSNDRLIDSIDVTGRKKKETLLFSDH